MKRLSTIMMCLLAMLAAGTGLKAQEVTIVLMPGYTWISIPTTDTLDFETALGSFTPAVGDMIKSRWGAATFRSDGQWRGSISEFYPGYGYHYYSSRTMPVFLTFNAQQPTPQLTVTTAEPTEITAVSAISGSSLTSSDGSYIVVQEKGICWATHPNPMVMNDFFTENGSGSESFTAEMTDLTPNTVYYVRAYAVTLNGTVYGDQKTFTTQDGIPILTTAEVTNIGNISAICGGTIISDGGLTTTRGVCWGTSQHPTVTDSHSNDGYGIGSFESQITGLTENTTYYVRAYASNSNITVYGDEVSFTTLDIPEGAIEGMFSVGENQQVYFSHGNLQFQASTGIWRFAENQWDYVGTQTPDIDGNYGGTVNGSDNGNISSAYPGWIDLFGWGTSGYHNLSDPYNVYFQPWSNSTSTVNTDYNYYGYGPSTNIVSPNLTASSANYDWGVYNPISNGGNYTSQWRTLTRQEWIYVFDTRNTASGIRFAKAIVNGVNGVILLPDNWSNNTYSLSYTNNKNANYTSNYLTALQWSILESAGAVFLPATGYRKNGNSVVLAGSQGRYWSTTFFNMDRAFELGFGGGGLSVYHETRCSGLSVRLVCPVE